ncbi:MAG: MlaD family protein [Deltaproteobacteria bacterium]|nr:MlaD family protein [Deltaproteobacteria bacterium]
MKIYLSYRERAAGLFLLAAILLVILFVAGAAVQNRWFRPQVAFHSHVMRGEGLRSGSPVLLSGVNVGEVGDLSIMPDNRIDMELLVDSKHSHRVRAGSKAVVRRLLGIGEKRIELVTGDKPGSPLPAGALLPADEPVDLLDAVSTIDLGVYMKTMDRAVSALEIMLTKLEENDRLERMVLAFDQLGPTMEKMNGLIGRIDEPLSKILNDPSALNAMHGMDRTFNDPYTHKALRAMAVAFEPERADQLMTRLDDVLGKLDVLMADGHLQGTLIGTDKLLNDGRMDRMLTAVEKLTDAEKLQKLVDNMAVLADQMARIGPEIPTLTREMMTTLREAVVVLKALQKTWLLESESKEAKEEMNKK